VTIRKLNGPLCSTCRGRPPAVAGRPRYCPEPPSAVTSAGAGPETVRATRATVAVAPVHSEDRGTVVPVSPVRVPRVAVFNDRRITKLIESVGADMEQRFQGLDVGVAALRTEVADAVRQVQQQTDGARQDLARDLAERDRRQLAELLAALRREVASLRQSLPSAGPSAGSAAAASVVESSVPTELEASMEKPRRDTHARGVEAAEAETLRDLFDVLTWVALISTAEVQCHPHTWAFIVRHVAQQDLVHELLPEPQDEEPDALIAVNVSGPVLMGILNALHQAKEWPKGQPLTRADIEEKALAGALYTRLSQHLANAAGPSNGTRTLIVIDDRPADEPPKPEYQADTTTEHSSPADGATGDTWGEADESEDAATQSATSEAARDGDETTTETDSTPSEHAGEIHQAELYLISGQLLLPTHPLYCVAKRKTTNGLRCRNPLAYGESGHWTTVTTNAGNQVRAYDIGENPRWLAQHCTTHHADPTTEDYCPPRWRTYPHAADSTR